MGLAEHIRAGARLTRTITTINDVTGVGSASLGPTYVVTNIQSSENCRFRLYDDATSRDDAGEAARTFANRNISASVALVGDFSMSAHTALSVDPVLFGHSQNFDNPLSYYRVSPAGTTIQITRYLLENKDFPPRVGTAYTEDNRRVIPTITGTLLGPTSGSSGSLVTTGSVTIPKTYLLISASITNSDPKHVARLRLYATNASIYDPIEKARSFSVEPSASVRLVADMILSGSEITKFTPKIIGVNTENLLNNLNEISGNDKINGLNEIYYLIQNTSSSGAPVTFNANLYVYALED